MDYAELGKCIQQERHRLHLTQAALAERVNVTTAYIGQIERGERKFSIETLVSIASALNVSVDYLLRGNIAYNSNSAIEELTKLIGNDEEYWALAVDVLKPVIEVLRKAERGKSSR